MIRCRYYICRFLRTRVIFVEAFPVLKSSMAQLPTHLTLVIFIRVVGITRATVTSIVATLTTTVLLLVVIVVPTCSCICQHVILVFLVSLCPLRCKACLSIKKARIESLETDRFSHAVNVFNQQAVISVQSIKDIRHDIIVIKGAYQQLPYHRHNHAWWRSTS
jgi:hypothetical protein